MKDKSWNLGDVEERGDVVSRKHPKPPKEMLEPLEKGHKVKLLFNFKTDNPQQTDSEELWVEILLVDGDKFLGQLEDDPKHTPGLMRGEIIEFLESNILETD